MSTADELLSELSREIALEVDRAGRVVWADPRALALLGACQGRPLPELASAPHAERARELVARAAREHVQDFDLPLQTAQGPLVLRFNGAPSGEQVALVGARLALAVDADALVRTLRRELGDSERGVKVLHEEIAEKADSLQVMREQKSRLVANVSHELRTPLNSILGLARILLSHEDGALTPEQEKQINFIRRSAEGLSLLVTDMLDIARLDAGKVVLRPTRFTAEEVFSGLRGTLKGLDAAQVQLLFEPVPPGLPTLETDEGKLSQILRNLVSNALKFTERGEVRVSAAATDFGAIAFSVQDTGIGIAPADQLRIFEEFFQAEHPIQRKVKGAGLGLSVSRRLATVLGGELRLQSRPGEGSTFTLVVPAVHPDVVELKHLQERSAVLDPQRAPVLVVEDDRQTLLLYEKYLRGSGFQVIPARSVDEARAAMRALRPSAVVLDVMLEGESSWRFLQEMKGRGETRDIPVLVVTVMDREDKARALGADEFCMKPLEPEWLLKKLRTLARTGPVEKVLVIDDDEISRYLVKKLLEGTSYSVIEAATGPEGISLARAERPDVIFLDFVLPDMTAFEVLDELKRDPATRAIPVIIATAQSLNDTERSRLAAETAAVLPKQGLSREVAIARIRDALEKAVPRSP